MNKDIFRKADLIIYAAILLLAAAAFLLYFHAHKSTGSTAAVSVDGVCLYRFPLNPSGIRPGVPFETDIAGYNGGSVHLVIRDGKADVTEATCPDHICVKHRPISRAGESIVCLPNRVVVTIEGDTAGIDAVSQ